MTAEAEAAAMQALERALQTLRVMFPNSTGVFTDPAQFKIALAVWSQGLRGQNLFNPAAIGRGLDKCMQQGKTFAPSLPEFVELCQPTPADVGCPDSMRAYRIACECSHPAVIDRAVWVHPAIYAAALRVGLWNLANLPESETRDEFHAYYLDACSRFANGYDLPSLPPPIPDDHPIFGKRTARGGGPQHAGAIAALELEKIRELLKIKNPTRTELAHAERQKAGNQDAVPGRTEH